MGAIARAVVTVLEVDEGRHWGGPASLNGELDFGWPAQLAVIIECSKRQSLGLVLGGVPGLAASFLGFLVARRYCTQRLLNTGTLDDDLVRIPKLERFIHTLFGGTNCCFICQL